MVLDLFLVHVHTCISTLYKRVYRVHVQYKLYMYMLCVCVQFSHGNMPTVLSK